MDMVNIGTTGPPDIQWPDLYALLGANPAASDEELRTRIREAYIEATTNADHRNVERRIHYQMLAHRIVPQARRILVEERTRRAYDYQLALHRQGDPRAMSYTVFVAKLSDIENGQEVFDQDHNTSTLSRNENNSGILASLANDLTVGAAATGELQSHLIATALFDSAHDVLRSERKYAEMAPLPSMAADMPAKHSTDAATRVNATTHTASTPDTITTSELELDKRSVVAEPVLPSLQEPSHSAETSAHIRDVPEQIPANVGLLPSVNNATTPTDKKPLAAAEPSTQSAVVTADSELCTEVNQSAAPVYARVLRADTLGETLGQGVHGVVSARRSDVGEENAVEGRRINVGDTHINAVGARRKNKRHSFLSRNSVMLLTAIMAGTWVMLIQHFVRSSPAAVANRPTLRIVYSSELHNVMERACRRVGSQQRSQRH
jgi:hypothetical protein